MRYSPAETGIAKTPDADTITKVSELPSCQNRQADESCLIVSDLNIINQNEPGVKIDFKNPSHVILIDC